MSPSQSQLAEKVKNDESKTYNSIVLTVAKQLVGSLSAIGSTLYRRPPEHRVEANAFREICTVSVAKRPIEGLYAGLVAFAALRLAPHVAARMRRATRYQLDVAPGKLGRSVVLRSVKLGLDLAASGVVCYYSADVCLNPPILAAQVACLPLQEGRSTFSDTMCPGIQEQVARLPTKFWDQHEQIYPRQALILANHCRLRQQYERKLRTDHGIAPDSPVSIPPPGVPTISEMIEGRGKEREMEE
jgi:hypothetical protein